MAGGKVNKDEKIDKFIAEVMALRNNVKWDIDDNPLRTLPDKSASYSELDTKAEPDSKNFREVESRRGEITAAALAAIFQIYAHNLTRYRPVRMYIRASNGKSITDYGTKPTALKSTHKMDPGTFKGHVDASPNIGSLAPGNTAAGAALDSLILKLKKVVSDNMSGTSPHRTISACHNSCHQSCHGSRSRR